MRIHKNSDFSSIKKKPDNVEFGISDKNHEVCLCLCCKMSLTTLSCEINSFHFISFICNSGWPNYT